MSWMTLDLIPTPMCKLYACRIYFVSILNGFIPVVVNSRAILISSYMFWALTPKKVAEV